MELPDVSLGELYSLLGEKDVRIYQGEKKIIALEKQLQVLLPAPDATPPAKDPFKKGK
jgi:hypothetical protein